MTRIARGAGAVLAALALVGAFEPAPASASVPCRIARAGSGVVGKACEVLGSPGKLLSAGKNLITGHIGKAFSSLFGGGGGSSAASTASTALAIAAVVAWAVGGAKLALHETAKVLSETTRPQLETTWFSAAYWRMAGIAALLTVPFLFAAAVQALMRSDLALLARSAFGYLPLAMLAISIAAPLTMLLLTATDQLCALVSSGGGARALTEGGLVAAGAGAAGAPFITFLFAAVTGAAAVVLWTELAIREAAVYVIVLLLPLMFAALVWPARRVWAVRAAELLVALILSKFAIVAVIGLGGAALGHSHGLTATLAGTVLVLLGAFAPWAVLRLLPLSELAATAVGSLTPQLETALPRSAQAGGSEESWPQAIAAAMRRHAEESAAAGGRTNGTAYADAERLSEQADARAQVDPPRSAELAGSADIPTPAGWTPQSSTDAAAAPPQSSTDAGDPSPPPPRLPGLGPKWQLQDLSWPSITLGPESFEDGEWRGPRLDIWPEDSDPLPPALDDRGP
jgi:hypothetical protein